MGSKHSSIARAMGYSVAHDVDRFCERSIMENRLTEIEIKLTQMEDLVETLNLTVFRQHEQIAHLQQQHQLLSQQLQEMALSSPREPNDESPPHY